jgi:hypothetical protein
LVIFDREKMLSTVSLTPAINCFPVSTTPAINCIDDRGLLLLQNYLRPLKWATAADIVILKAMKTLKGTSQTLIRGPGGRQSYFKPKRHYLVLATSGAVWGVF